MVQRGGICRGCAGNEVGSSGATALAEAIKVCTALQHVDVGRKQHSHEQAVGYRLCCTVSQVVDVLHAVFCSENDMGASGSRAIAMSLKHCTRLHVVDLSCECCHDTITAVWIND